jgi:type II secretory pathway pseudopilin PulG
MNTQFNRQLSRSAVCHQQGMTLLDVLLAIVIFTIGMLALASLQGNLTRSSADANARTVGTNLAEDLIEQFRTYERLESAAGIFAYQDIVDDTLNFPDRGGVDYTVQVAVDDYFFLPDGETVTMDTDELPENRDTTISDFKFVELDVTWTGGEFQRGDGQVTSNRLGSGSFTVSTVVASIPRLGPAKVAAEEEGVGSPPVKYTPGERPDIIQVSVDGGVSKYKESTTPLPIVQRRDELVETWFDVITYNQISETEAEFLRREEFVALSCECTLRASTANAGRLPTVWTGAEYKEGALAEKQYGEGATNQQSQYCDICCRDHHDTSSNSDEAFRPWDPDGAHPHYTRDRQGNLTEAGVGDDYLEACRLVRKDGFFRVAQDFDMKNEVAFPRDFLEVPDNASAYSNYVVTSVEAHFADPDEDFTPHALTFEGDTPENPILLPSVDSSAETRRLMSRSIYTDYLNDELSKTLTDCFPSRTADCTLPEGTTELEVLPFFDVQVTKLARWSENPFQDPVAITNEDFSNVSYDRGLAELDGSREGTSTGLSRIESSNIGLIDTLPIKASPATNYFAAQLYFQAGESTEPPPPDGSIIINGTITNQGGTSDAGAASIVGSSGVTCERPTPGTFRCAIAAGASGDFFITVSDYYKKNVPLLVCSNNSVLTYIEHNAGSSAATNWTRFQITSFGSGASITIVSGDSC